MRAAVTVVLGALHAQAACTPHAVANNCWQKRPLHSSCAAWMGLMVRTWAALSVPGKRQVGEKAR